MSDDNLKSSNSAIVERKSLLEENNGKLETESLENDGKDIVETEIDGPPIDRGWAWVVLGACVFEIVLYGGIMRSFGVFFLQYQMRFNSSASETAIMSLIQNMVLSTTALLVMTVGLQKFSSRASVLMGGTITVAAYLITAFATDIRVFYVAQGMLGGFGLALIHPPMLAIIGVYFKKHRGLANSIFTGGGSIGGLVFAPIVVKLFEEYQYTGTLLIISGLLMNIWVAALLMRPIESYTKQVKVKYVDEGTEINEEDRILLNEVNNHVSDESEDIKLNEITVDALKTESDTRIYREPITFTRMHSLDPELARSKPQGSPLLQRVRASSFRLRQRTISDDNSRYDSENSIHHSNNLLKGVINAISKSQLAIYTSGEGICGSFVDINVPPSKNLSTKSVNSINEHEIVENDTPQKSCLTMKSCIFSVLCKIFDLSLLRNPVFLTFLLMAFSIMSGVGLLPVFIPTHAKDIGLSNEKIGLLISIMAAIDLASKITMGVVADRNWIKRSTILVIAAVVLGTMSHLVRFVNSFPAMIVLVVIAGLCCGQYMSIYAVLLMDVIGPEKFKSSLGFGTLVHGTSIAVFFPIAGLLRDATGSYVASFHLLGGLAYLAGVLALIVPIVNKRKKKRESMKEIKVGDKT